VNDVNHQDAGINLLTHSMLHMHSSHTICRNDGLLLLSNI